LKHDLASFSGKTIQAMLERTPEKEVAGSWRTRGYQDHWWLERSATRMNYGGGNGYGNT